MQCEQSQDSLRITNPKLFAPSFEFRAAITRLHEKRLEQIELNSLSFDFQKNQEEIKQVKAGIARLNEEFEHLMKETERELRRTIEYFCSDNTKSFMRMNDSTYHISFLDIKAMVEKVGLEYELSREFITKSQEIDLILYRGERDVNGFEIKIYNPSHQRRNVRQARLEEEKEVLPSLQQQKSVEVVESVEVASLPAEDISQFSTVPDVIRNYSISSMGQSAIQVRCPVPECNGCAIDKFRVCVVESGEKRRYVPLIERSAVGESFEFVLNFAQIEGVDYKRQLLPFDEVVSISVLAHNEKGWASDMGHSFCQVFMERINPMGLYLRGKLTSDFAAEYLTDPDEDLAELGQEVVNVRSFSPVNLDFGRIKSVALGHRSALLGNWQSEVCQWGRYVEEEEKQVEEESLPFAINLREGVNRLAVGHAHCLCATVSGQVYSWGENSKGQLGIGGFQWSFTPRLVGFFVEERIYIADVCAGHSASLARSHCGRLFSWGENQNVGDQSSGLSKVVSIKNRFGEVVNFSNLDVSFQAHPREVNLRVKQIAAGYFHYGVISAEGRVCVWGDNHFGCLGLKEYSGQTILNLVYPLALELETGEDEIKEIALGGYHSMVRVSRRDGQDDYFLSWGQNSSGQCGHGGITDEVNPGRVEETPQCRFLQVSCGLNHTLFLCEDGKVYGCGGNETFQVSDEKKEKCFPRMVQIKTSLRVKRVVAGEFVSGVLAEVQ